MKDEADNKTQDWVGHKIELVYFENSRAIFEIGSFDAYFHVDDFDLEGFINGELVISPRYWIDSEGRRVERPDWFGRKELSELNNVFERDFKKFRK